MFDQIGDGDRQANRSNVLCIEACNDVALEVNTSRYELFATSVSHTSPSRDIKALCCENRHRFFSFLRRSVERNYSMLAGPPKAHEV